MQEANRLKSEFLANMSHELRTPLNAIIGFSELMYHEKVGPVSEEHKEYLGDILTSARHLLQLINDVLDLTKVEAGKMEFRPEILDLAKVTSEVRDILRGLASPERHSSGNPNRSGPFESDSGRLQIQASALQLPVQCPQIHFRSGKGHHPFDTPRFKAMFRLEVEDTGIGIKREDLHKLFIEFQQLDAGSAKKYAGTGLGLALTKRIVEAQGGKVGVQSEFGKGSVFFAEFPLEMKEVSGGGETILIVDDNPINLKLVKVYCSRKDTRFKPPLTRKRA